MSTNKILETITRSGLPPILERLLAPVAKELKDHLVLGTEAPAPWKRLKDEDQKAYKTAFSDVFLYQEYENFFRERGCNINNEKTVATILEAFENRDKLTLNEINEKRNPYLLAQFRNVDFPTLDKMGQYYHKPRTAESRLAGAIVLSAVQALGWGGTKYSVPYLRKRALEHLTPIGLKVENKNGQNLLGIEHFRAGGKHVHTMFRHFTWDKFTVRHNPTFWSEHLIAKSIKRLIDSKPLLKPIGWKPILSLDIDQETAIKTVLENPFTIWTGGPGVGKTKTVLSLVELLKNQKISYALSSTTGITAKDLGGVTVHSLLNIRPDRPQTPYCNPKRPLPYSVVICDEFSMADTVLAGKLFNAIGDGCRLVIVGDPYQIPSVEPGNVLYDLTHGSPGRIPWVELTHQYRNDNLVFPLAKILLHDGSADDFKAILEDAKKRRNVHHHTFLTSDELKMKLREYVQEDPDSMVVSPVYNNNNGLGVKELNDLVQEIVNPCSDPVWGFCVGDRVVQKHADYINHIRNGESGVCVKTEQNKVSVLFDGYKEPITHQAQGINRNWSLAYVTTAHKNQGRQADQVICIINKHWRKPMLYTSMTRSKETLVLLEINEHLMKIVEEKPRVRRTNLVERIINKIDLLSMPSCDNI